MSSSEAPIGAMAAIDGTKFVITIDSSDDEEESKKNSRSCKIAAQSSDQNTRNKEEEKNNGDIARFDGVSCNNYVYRSKAEEYKILADLSMFPRLAAMFAFEATISKKSRKRNQKKQRNKMQKLEAQSPNPIIDKAGKGDVAVLDKRSVILSTNDMPQKLLEAENMAANEYQKFVVLLDINGKKPLKNDTIGDKSATQLSEASKKESTKEVQENENGDRSSKDIRPDIRYDGDINGNNYVYRTKAEEYKMLADMSEFPQLAAMFAFEARMKKKKRAKAELVAPISNKPDDMANNEELKHEKLVVLPDIRDGKALKNDWTHNKNTTQLSELQKGECSKVIEEDEHGGRNNEGDRTGGDTDKDNYVYRTKAEEYKMLADLSGFTQLSAMSAFEARMKKKKSMKVKENKRKKQKLEIGAPRTDETSKTAEVLDATLAIISKKGITQRLLVDGPDDNNQGKTHKTSETTEEINVDNAIRSAIVIDKGLPFLEGLEGHEENSGLGNLRGLVETEQTVALVREEQKIFDERDYTNIAVEVGKLVDSTKDAQTMTSLKIESVERKQNFALRKLLQSPRYFDLPISSWQLCYNRGKDDHNAAECTMERKKKPCYICGGLEHSAKHCKQGRDCFKCNRRGHFARDCLEKDPSSNGTSDICLKCGDLGHDMFSCYNEYSPDDLKKIQCSICKEFGHLCCVDFMHEGPKIVTCYKCGQNGHLGSGCTKLLRGTTGRRANTFCKKCKIKGHFARECREYVKGGQSRR